MVKTKNDGGILPPPSSSNNEDWWALAALAETLFWAGDPRFVLADGEKRPIHAGWSSARPGLREVQDHLAAGGLVGLEPSSIGSAVFDADRAPVQSLNTLAAAGVRPWAEVQSRRRDRRHFWVKTAESQRPGRWAYGDILGRSSFAVLHRPAALARCTSGLRDAYQVPTERIRQLRLFRGSAATGRPSAETTRPIRGGLVAVGERNAWLYRRLLSAPKTADIPALAAQLNRTAMVEPLPTREVEKTARSAAKGRARLAERGLLNARQVARGRLSGTARWQAAEARNEAIRAAAAGSPGLTAAALAVRFGVTTRTIFRALAGV